MAVVKLTPDLYSAKGDVIKLANYMYDPIKCKSLIEGGKNLICQEWGDPYCIAQQFLTVQHGQRFKRRVYHVIVSFDPVLDGVDRYFAYRIGQRICELYPEYQSVFVLHEDKAALHIHMIFNNCPIFSECHNLTNEFDLWRIKGLVDAMIDSRSGIV